MDWHAALRARLIAASPVSALVSSRITWVERPQMAALPAITLQTMSDDRPQHMEGFMGLNPARVQIDCWSTKHAEANDLADKAIAALAPANTANGIRFDRAFVDSKRDLGERVETQFIHRVSVDLILHYSTA
jgi:hypothetical protein